MIWILLAGALGVALGAFGTLVLVFLYGDTADPDFLTPDPGDPTWKPEASWRPLQGRKGDSEHTSKRAD